MSRTKRHHLQTPIMAISDDGKITYDLDYRSKNDDAWYTAGVVLEKGKQLRVKLESFESSDDDEVFSTANFSKHHEIEEFLDRFRPVSVPFDHDECSTLIEGTKVCATYTYDGSVRYFDAIVDAVYFKEHTPEKCLCTYLLFWQHGPDEGNITAAPIDGICHIMSGALDPKITDFLKPVREKLTRPSSQSSHTSKTPFLSRKTSSNQTLKKLQASSSDSSSNEDSSSVRFSKGTGKFKTELYNQDKEMGGIKETGSHHHYIILENLEKNLSPVIMTEFIHEQTSITTSAFVFPSLSTETYARGAVIVDTRQKLKMIHEFITNPNHFIVSKLTGRPWVIGEDVFRDGAFNINLHMLQPKSENKNIGGKLKLVRLGTEEYERAKKSKDLYMEFRNHVNGLVKRLDMEEKKKWGTN
ncbi:hypothetical protein LXL04_037967 [Taraxacum kok-saghyz]